MMCGPKGVKPRGLDKNDKTHIKFWAHFALFDSGDYTDETAGGAFEPALLLHYKSWLMNDSPSSVLPSTWCWVTIVYWEKVMMQTIDRLPLRRVQREHIDSLPII